MEAIEISREDVLSRFRLTDHLQSLGVKINGSGSERRTNRCPLHEHKKDHQCVTIFWDTQGFHCNDCNCGGTIVDWLAAERNVQAKQVYKELCDSMKPSNGSVVCPSKNGSPKPKQNQPEREVCHYDYTDEHGEVLYRVVRMEPKSFRQWRSDGTGGFVKNMDGVTRVLYHLHEVIAAETVIVCEGEKDVDNLRDLGFHATTSAGGASHWLDAYSDFLRGKHVVVIPDKDEPGRKYADAVIASLQDKALSIKLVPMPGDHKDASDYIGSFELPFLAFEPLQKLISETVHILKPIPFLSIRELEERYIQSISSDQSRSFDLGQFLPSLGGAVRKLIPGELVCIMAGTGVGKTAIMQGLSIAAAPLQTLFFQLELPAELMFERFVQMERQIFGDQVERDYKDNPAPRWQSYNRLSHIIVCPESGLTVDSIESLILRSELKTGRKPTVVIIDYIGLVRNEKGKSRYEAVSHTAEQLKVIAKKTKTIIIMGTQVHRPYKAGKKTNEPDGKDVEEVGLNDGKDSGSIENSAGLVIGAWRTDATTLKLRVLKNTKGLSGREITCNFDGGKMRITERANEPSQNGEPAYHAPYADNEVPEPQEQPEMPI